MTRTVDKETPGNWGVFEVRPEAVRVVCPADYRATVRHLARCTRDDGRRDGSDTAPKSPVTG